MACVNGSTGPLTDSAAAAERAAYLKKVGKAQWGSVVVVEAEPPAIHVQEVNPQAREWEEHALAMLYHLLGQPRMVDDQTLLGIEHGGARVKVEGADKQALTINRKRLGMQAGT